VRAVRERLQLERARVPRSSTAPDVQAERLRSADSIGVAVSRRHIDRQLHVRCDRSRHVRSDVSTVSTSGEARTDTDADAGTTAAQGVPESVAE
jgi:hypothetical protein